MATRKKLDTALCARRVRETIERMIITDGHTEGITAGRVAAAVGISIPSFRRVLGVAFGAYFRANYPSIENPRQVARRELFLETGRRLALERGLANVTARRLACADSGVCKSWVQRNFPEPKAPVMVAALQAGELRTVGEAIALRLPAALVLPMETKRAAVDALLDGGPGPQENATGRAA